MNDPTSTASTLRRRFTVVLRAPTPLVFLEGEGFRITNVPTANGPATVSYTSRWIQKSNSTRLPGQLWIEVIGFGADLKSAVPTLSNVGVGALASISLAANVAIEHPAIELAFETGADLEEREFFQAFVRPESNDIAEGRLANPANIAAVYEQLTRSDEKDRLQRAANQYRLALDHWRVGAETLALAPVDGSRIVNKGAAEEPAQGKGHRF